MFLFLPKVEGYNRLSAVFYIEVFIVWHSQLFVIDDINPDINKKKLDWNTLSFGRLLFQLVQQGW